MAGRFSFIALSVFLLAGIAQADIGAITADGKHVLLKDDNTWSYVEEETDQETEYVALTVVKKQPLANGCKLGFRLDNHMTVDIRTLVPQFSAYIGENVLFQTVSKEFLRIRPTLTQYQEVLFTKIQCRDIQYVKVHGGDRCNMGELNRFSPVRGECLKKIRIIPSDVFNVIKQPYVEEEYPESEDLLGEDFGLDTEFELE